MVMMTRSAVAARNSSGGHPTGSADQEPKPTCPSTQPEAQAGVENPACQWPVWPETPADYAQVRPPATSSIATVPPSARIARNQYQCRPHDRRHARDLVTIGNRQECRQRARPSRPPRLVPSGVLAGHAVESSWHRSLVRSGGCLGSAPSRGPRFARSASAWRTRHRCRRRLSVYL